MIRARLHRSTIALALAAGSVAVLAACSSGEEEAAVPDGADPAMVELCDQMVADGLSPEDADALAVENGYVTRVGTVDGVPNAVTSDYRMDRFTFEVENGAVVACQYG